MSTVTTYELRLAEMKVEEDSGRSDCVTKLYWNYEGICSNVAMGIYATATYSGITVSTSSGTADSDYISFDSLTANNVYSWIDADIRSRAVSNSEIYTTFYDEMEESLAADMDESIDGTVTTQHFPWNMVK